MYIYLSTRNVRTFTFSVCRGIQSCTRVSYPIPLSFDFVCRLSMLLTCVTLVHVENEAAALLLLYENPIPDQKF